MNQLKTAKVSWKQPALMAPPQVLGGWWNHQPLFNGLLAFILLATVVALSMSQNISGILLLR